MSEVERITARRSELDVFAQEPGKRLGKSRRSGRSW